MCKEQATIAKNLSAYISATTPPIAILLASSKQRSSLHRSIATDKTKIHAAIRKYCVVQELLLSDEHFSLAEENILNGEFPWSHLSGLNSAAIRLQHKAAEKYNLKCWLKEEEVLLLQEMTSFLSFYRSQIESLKQEITACESEDTLADNQLMMDNIIGKYISSNTIQAVLNGKTALLKRQLEHTKKRLSMAKDIFSGLVDEEDDIIIEEFASDTDSDEIEDEECL
ncbi:uncharacterized protein [Dysidea avara]|uniref:uncharacterized protein isoform X2 n=1 Tax=Dysidea avara TaxID=196820 RepID=UPI00331AEC9D